MKTKKGLIALAITFVTSLLLFSACRHHSARGTFALDYVTEVLDLTEVQEKKLDGIREEIMADVERMHEEQKSMHDTLKQQIAGEAIDKEIVRQLVTDHRTKMDSIIDIAIDRLADFHLDLTPEQRTKLVSKLEKFEKHHERYFNR